MEVALNMEKFRVMGSRLRPTKEKDSLISFFSSLKRQIIFVIISHYFIIVRGR